LVVAGEGRDGPVAVLELVVGGAESRAPPARLEQEQQAVEAARRLRARAGLTVALAECVRAHGLGVEALEDLVDEDPEALVDRRLPRNREDARELVLERAGPIEVDVRGRERQAVAPPGDELLERGLATRGHQLATR